MTVQELIDYLSELPRELEIIVGSDDEGNDFIHPYRPSEYWCFDDDTTCGYRPVAEEDVGTEYNVDDLVKMVVM